MIKPDWNIFKAKFSDNPQFHFEWFCYLLFCKEFDQSFGVFRYKNQSGIETDPIEYDGKQVGFQSKFYETTLSSNKDELISTLDKSKRDYPNLKKIYIYSNQEWTQAFPKNNNPEKKAHKTAAQTEIEDKAKQLKIELIWRTASYFESPFVIQTCSDISKYFFCNTKSVLDLIKFQEDHTQSILKNIKSTMLFNGQQISIDREDVQAALKDGTETVSIVCGQGGVGKTVEIKKLLESRERSLSLFAFKATEFELKNLNELLDGNPVYDFLSFFGNDNNKVIVIDSAEKLMDLDNQEPFKEFIDLAVEKEWRIIFTTRDHYFDDLNHLCIDILQLVPKKLYIPKLSDSELEHLAHEHNFQLPSDSRLKELLRLPIYLNAFLKFYAPNSSKSLNLPQFKEYLWNKIIKNGDIRREKVFSDFAIRRANEGKFFIPLSGTDIEIAKFLSKDEVLGIEGSSFFISHDIYEEWALEKFIDLTYKNRISVKDFFESIGVSLPVRRCFRLWISEQLQSNKDEITFFIEQAIDQKGIFSVWKDELIAAILLSDYSYTFFDNFKRDLLTSDLSLTKRICFILRIACKELDNSLLMRLNLKHDEQWYFTKPKGSGWDAFISFIFQNINQIGIDNIAPFIPALYEWNSSVKTGKTTKKASLLCLNYYRHNELQHSYSLDGKFTESVLKIIAYGAEEIKTELMDFIDDVCESKKKEHTRYYDNFAKLVLKEFDGIYIAKALPSKVLEMANVYWFKDYSSRSHYRMHREIEIIFGVTDSFEFKYHPESAYQTPIINLLRFDLKATLDFILSFINKVTDNLISHYSDIDFPTHKLSVDGVTSEIVLDQHLWGVYRGADNAPDLVKSVLMALEKFFLDAAKDTSPRVLGLWLKYLLKNTNSSAICAVVSSIVLANRDKLFDVAILLFEVKEFIQFDTARRVFDSQHKSQLEMLGNMFGGLSYGKAYHNARIESCDAPHRSESLETLCLYYQIFSSKNEVDQLSFNQRQSKVWTILDNYYAEVESAKDTKDLKLWRMCLARMDRRKMEITTKDMGDKIALNFTPELTPDLIEMSEKHQVKNEQDFQYTSLFLWSQYKLEQNEDYKKYEHYESNPNNAIAELNGLVHTLTDKANPPSDSFVLFNRATHIYASAVLLKFHFEDLSEVDKLLCIDIINDCYKCIFDENYQYKIGDGLDACFKILPELFNRLPDSRPFLKLVLIGGLIRTDSISVFGNQSFYAYAISAIVQLWINFKEDVRSIYWAYILLHPLYIELIDKIRQESYERNQFKVNFEDLWQRLSDENEPIFSALETNDIVDKYSVDYEKLDLQTKSVALFILPNESFGWPKDAFMQLVSSSVHLLLSNDIDRSRNYQSAQEFFKKSASYILSSSIEDIPQLLQPFITHFSSSEGIADFLEEFILAQDHKAAYDEFWEVWELFKPKVVELVHKKHFSYRDEKIIKSYLFALPWWKQETRSWHTLKERETRFLGEMAVKLSRSPTTLYSFAKLLNDIGSEFLPHGVSWLASIIKNNQALATQDLDDNTVYYINKYMRKYLYRKRANVRRTPELMANTLTILDFLIEKGEVSGYLMRESIV